MMRDEERQKFLAALKDGASWVQLYQIRNTIRKLNDMIDAAGHGHTDSDSCEKGSSRGEEGNPRTAF